MNRRLGWEISLKMKEEVAGIFLRISHYLRGCVVIINFTLIPINAALRRIFYIVKENTSQKSSKMRCMITCSIGTVRNKEFDDNVCGVDCGIMRWAHVCRGASGCSRDIAESEAVCRSTLQSSRRTPYSLLSQAASFSKVVAAERALFRRVELCSRCDTLITSCSWCPVFHCRR